MMSWWHSKLLKPLDMSTCSITQLLHLRHIYYALRMFYEFIWSFSQTQKPNFFHWPPRASLPAPEGEHGPLCAWLTASLPFCSALRLAALILHTLPYVFPSLPHTSCSILHRQTPLEPRRLPAASSLHSNPSPQGRSFLRPQGSPSRGEHTRQQLHLSGTYPPGQLGLGHEPTSQREAHLSERTAPVKSCVKRNAAISKSNCILMSVNSARELGWVWLILYIVILNVSKKCFFCVRTIDE